MSNPLHLSSVAEASSWVDRMFEVRPVFYEVCSTIAHHCACVGALLGTEDSVLTRFAPGFFNSGKGGSISPGAARCVKLTRCLSRRSGPAGLKRQGPQGLKVLFPHSHQLPLQMTHQEPYRGSTRTLVLAFDVGTTFSGIGYAILDPGEIPKIQAVTRWA